MNEASIALAAFNVIAYGIAAFRSKGELRWALSMASVLAGCWMLSEIHRAVS